MLSENALDALEMLGIVVLPGAVTCGVYLWLRGRLKMIALCAVFVLPFALLILPSVPGLAPADPTKCGMWIYLLYALITLILVSMCVGLGVGWAIHKFRQMPPKTRQMP